MQSIKEEKNDVIIKKRFFYFVVKDIFTFFVPKYLFMFPYQ